MWLIFCLEYKVLKSKRVGTRVIAWGHLRKLGESAELWLAVNRRFKGIGSSWLRRELRRRRWRSRPNVTTTPTQWKTTSMRPKSKIFTFYRLVSEIRFFLICLNPQAPVAQKIAEEMVFRHFQGEGVEFF